MRQVPPRSPAVRRWKYPKFDVHAETRPGGPSRAGDGRPVPAKVTSVVRVLDDLGVRGELAGQTSTQSPLIYRLFLKRRAAAQRA